MLEMFSLAWRLLEDWFGDDGGIPLLSQPFALTGVNYTLDGRETAAHCSGGGGGSLQLSRQWLESLLATWAPLLCFPSLVLPTLGKQATWCLWRAENH